MVRKYTHVITNFSFGHQVSHLEICRLGRFQSMFFQNILAETHIGPEPVNVRKHMYVYIGNKSEESREGVSMSKGCELQQIRTLIIYVRV